MSAESKSKSKSKLDSLSEEVQRMRDEVKVQLHLGAAEVRDEWDELEGKLGRFRAQYDGVATAAEDAVDGVLEAASLAGDELVKGYQRIKGMLKK